MQFQQSRLHSAKVRPNILLLAQLSLASALSTVFELAFILFIVNMLSPFFKQSEINSSDLTGQIISSLLCACLSVACTLFAKRWKVQVASSVSLSVREAVFTKLLSLGPIYRERGDMSVPKALSGFGSHALASFYSKLIPSAASCLALAMVFFVVIAPKSIVLAIILVATFVVSVVLYLAVLKFIKGKKQNSYMSANSVWSTFKSAVYGVNTLVRYGADDSFAYELTQQSAAAKDANIKQQELSLLPAVAFVVGLLLGLSAALVFALTSAEVDVSLLSLVIAVSVSALIALLPVWNLAQNLMFLELASHYSNMFSEFMALPEDAHGGSDSPNPGDHFFLKSVSYTYKDDMTEALRDVTLDIPSVGITAIVGTDTSGKSTLARIITGRLRDYTGTILLGGKDLLSFSQRSLSSYVTYVGAGSHHFSKSIRENLHIADPFATDPALIQALRAVGLAEEIRQKGGLDISLEDAHLGQGELSRLSVARAILHKSDVYILDDLGANLDSQSEHYIVAAIQQIARYKAVIILSSKTCEYAQNIYVMDNGKLSCSGSHDQLMHLSDVYFSIWESEQALDPLRMSAHVEEDDNEK